MSFFNLNNFDCLVFDGITTRFSTKEQTKWLNATLYIEKPKKKLAEPERKYVFGEGISIFRSKKYRFILSGYCENSKFGLHFHLNKKFKKLEASIVYQGFLKGDKLEIVCNEASGILILDSELTLGDESNHISIIS